ncbi:MAG: glycosyltransferase family 39 protein, partial [Burkholderiales bacterium]|nr:glycosyltransferase family 39 protein [Burkholderiales bacterium]
RVHPPPLTPPPHMRILRSVTATLNAPSLSLGLMALAPLLMAFAWLWLGHLGSVALSPPADNIEQLVWMHSLQWGYYKHPPLPTWLMWAFSQVAGDTAASSAWLGALCTLLSVGVLASLLQKIEGPRFAAVGVLAALSITFYNGRLNYYNHNVVLLLWVACSAWVWWHIVQSKGHLRWWLALGVLAGLGMLTKYQYMVSVMCALWLYVQSGMWRVSAHRVGLAWAVCLATLMVLPHLIWLLGAPESPIHYAVQSSLGAHLEGMAKVRFVANWGADWFFNRCLPAVLLVVTVGLTSHLLRRRQARAQGTSVRHMSIGSADGRKLLWTWGLGPAIVMAGIGLLWGVELQLQWGTAFALWTPPVVMLMIGLSEQTLKTGALRAAVAAFAVIQALLLWHSYSTSAFGQRSTTTLHWRHFPAQAIVDDIAAPARRLLGGPVTHISGITSASGALSLLMPERPKVLIDGNLKISPWIAPHEMINARILQIWAPGTAPADAMPTLNGWHWQVIDHVPADH